MGKRPVPECRPGARDRGGPKIRSIAFLLMAVALLGADLPSAHADIGSLFFKAPTNIGQPKGLVYVGFADGGDTGVYAIARQEEEPTKIPVIFILALGDEVSGYRVTKVTPEFLALSKGGVTVRVPLDPAAADIEASEVVESQKSVENKTPTRRSTMAFQSGASLDSLKAIAKAAGVPDAFLDHLQGEPVPARSRSGRPGWALDPLLPQLSSLGLPFEPGDIVLGIDGRSVHDFDELRTHLAAKPSDEAFRVEIQREGQLLMYEFQR
jgi:membrane-associated protease RseP (regulator of RpoE activity)